MYIYIPPRKKTRDPRFDPLSGSLNTEMFEKSYQFLDDYRKSEIDLLQKEMVQERDYAERTKMREVLSKMVCPHPPLWHIFPIIPCLSSSSIEIPAVRQEEATGA